MIANHALYFADLALRAKTGDGAGVLPEHDAVVFDEAHRLEESAAAWFGGRVSLGGLRQLLRDVERALPRGLASRARARARRDRPPRRGAARRARPRSRPPAPDRRRRRGGRRSRRRARPRRSSSSRRRSAAGATTSTCSRAARSPSVDDLGACLDRRRRGRRLWAEQGALAWAPIDVSETLREILWEREVVSVLVSATLEPRFLRRRGSGSTRRARSRCPRRTTTASRRSCTSRARSRSRARPATTRASPTRCSRSAGSREGRALVLTTSYRALDGLAERLAPRLPVPAAGPGRGAARAAARALPRRGRLGAAGHADLLAGRRRPGRVALAARHRQAAVRRAERPAGRGALRADREGRAATGSPSTRCRPRSSSSARASAG